MPRKCSVCTHSERGIIDELLISGSSFRDIAKRFGLSPTALWRHRKNDIPETLAKAEELREVVRAGKLHDQVNSLIGRSLAILREAEGRGDLRMALGAIRETRGNLELLAKVTGEWNAPRDPGGHQPMFILPAGCMPRFGDRRRNPTIEAEVIASNEADESTLRQEDE